MEFGPSGQGMSGPVPVTFQEIEAWSRMTHTAIPTYEALLLRQLSRDYVSQYHASSKPDEPQPMMPGDEVNREQVARGFADLIASQKAKK